MHHIRTLYEEVLRVPLIVKLPGGRPQGWRGSVPELVGGIDVAPTILDAAGLLAPPTFEGRSLVPLMRRPGPARPVFARTVRHDSNKAALREGALKMIHTFAESSERFEAYDLATDPGEISPLDLSGAERIPDLESGLSDIMSLDRMVAEEPLEPVRLTRDQLERLRALGYAD